MKRKTMSDMLRVTVMEGKYTLVQDKDGRTYALRYGEPWRDCVGDNLMLALGYAVEEAREALIECRNAIHGYKDTNKLAVDSVLNLALMKAQHVLDKVKEQPKT